MVALVRGAQKDLRSSQLSLPLGIILEEAGGGAIRVAEVRPGGSGEERDIRPARRRARVLRDFVNDRARQRHVPARRREHEVAADVFAPCDIRLADGDSPSRTRGLFCVVRAREIK